MAGVDAAQVRAVPLVDPLQGCLQLLAGHLVQSPSHEFVDLRFERLPAAALTGLRQ